MSPRVFGTLVAFIMLGIFVYLVWLAGGTSSCEPQPECLTRFTPTMASYMALIGGVISALVVAELAVTPPKETPVGRAVGASGEVSQGRERTVVQWLTSLYLIVWVMTGVYAFIKGLQDTAFQPIKDLGQAWFGLAIAAVYAYFGIKPPTRDSQGTTSSAGQRAQATARK